MKYKRSTKKNRSSDAVTNEKEKVVGFLCWIDDDIWIADKNYTGIWHTTITEIRLYHYGNTSVSAVYLDKYDDKFYSEDFGKSWFVAKEEAEKKFKELMEEK